VGWAEVGKKEVGQRGKKKREGERLGRGERERPRGRGGIFFFFFFLQNLLIFILKLF
jgi:hypothetical protein